MPTQKWSFNTDIIESYFNFIICKPNGNWTRVNEIEVKSANQLGHLEKDEICC